MGPETSPPADRAEGVSAGALGASRWELEAFRTAVLRYMLRDEVDERTAAGVVWNGGDWRPMVAELAGEHWQIAVRLTQQEAAGLPLEAFPAPAGRDAVAGPALPPGTAPPASFLPAPPPPAPDGWEFGTRRRPRRRGPGVPTDPDGRD
jgi:hypothetical protein